MTPKVIEKLAHKLGLPPGLKPYLELEAARLQLGAALFHHSTIKCDRGCEGNDEESDITSDEEDEDSWDESLSQPTSGHEDSTSGSGDDDDSDIEVPDVIPNDSFVPSIPERPRILSSSSSSSSDSLPELVDDLPRLRISVVPNDQQARDPRDESPPRDFFSFGATNEHHTIMRYVQQFVTGTFDHSTDSETDDDESNKEEIPRLE